MTLLRRLLDAVKQRITVVNTEGGTRIRRDGDRAIHQALQTGEVIWSLDLREVESISAYAQTVRAIDYITIQLHASGREYEFDDDAMGFSDFMRSLEADLGVPLEGEAITMATPAYGGAQKVLWARRDNAH